MNEVISKAFFLKIDINDSKRSNSFNKDLFSQKLNQTITNNSLHKKKLNSLKRHELINMAAIQKNKTNIFLSDAKDDKDTLLSNVLNKFNFPFISKNNNFWSIENNKQLINKNAALLSDFSIKEKYSKKEIKRILNLKKNNNEKFEKILDKKSENTKKENNLIINKENSNILNKNKMIGSIKKTNIKKIIIKKENSKEILSFEKTYNNIMKVKRSKFKNKSQEKISISAISQNDDKKEKETIIFLTNFYEDFIELFNSYDTIKYISLINKFNQTYFFLFDIKSFPKSQMNIKFLNTYKYSSILIICLVFLSIDENLYKSFSLKIKDFLEAFIFVCLNSINYKILESPKIQKFLECTKLKEEKSLIEILNNIIALLFNDKINDYKKLRKCLKQLANNINDISPEKILGIVNDSILFCHNCTYYLEEEENYKKKKKNIKKVKDKKILNNKNEDQKSNTNIQGPFIKNKMEKKFCLVIDLDETLIHNLNLPFGDYFFVRPGVFQFLEKIHDIYEIIIFTAGKKNYAYSIIDKIDSNNYINYILYKKHIIYEDGIPIKKLELIGRDLNKIIFVDNLENNAKYNKKNFYHISSWYNNIFDNEIDKLKEKLINIAISGKYDDDITKGLI